jgi:hypothetical protein
VDYSAPPSAEQVGTQPDTDFLWYETAPDTDLLWEQVDAETKLDEPESWQETLTFGSATVLVTALSAWYALWTFRGGCLVASFLSSIPAWRTVDPLPILEDFCDGPKRGTDGERADDESLHSLVAGSDTSAKTVL